MEKWKALPGFVGLYEVSDAGRVRSLDRYSNGLRRGRVLSQATKAKGYQQVTLCAADGRRAHGSVHRLVALAFIGPCPPGQVVRHLDDNARDNRLINIAYGTPTQNAQDKRRLGTHAEGSRHPRAKLTEDVVRRIRRDKAPRRGDLTRLAAEYGISVSHAHGIRSGQSWKHVEAH